MHGWSLFKQGRLEDALNSFFGVLDRKPALTRRRDRPRQPEGPDARRPRAGRKTPSASTSISLQNLQGAGVDPARTSTTDDAARLRVPRVPAAGRALHQARPRQGRRRHLRRVRQAAAAACAGTAVAGARDRDLPGQRLRHAGARREEGLRLRATASTANSARPTPTAGSARNRWSRPTSPSWRATTMRWRRSPRPAPTTRRPCTGTAPTSARSPKTRTRRRTTSCWPSCCSKTSSCSTPPPSTRRRRTAIPRTPRAPTPATRRC